MNRSQKIILLSFQHIVVEGNTGCYQFSNTTLHNTFYKTRIFQLITNGYTMTCTNKFG